MTETIKVWFNPRCSKARAARDLLAEKGFEPELYEYLERPRSKAELEEVLARLGTDDPRAIVRRKEAAYAELGLADADRDTVLAAMTTHPILVERPLVIRGGRAVVARPPERLLELLD